MKKRIFSMLLAIVMVVGLLPGAALTAFAEEGETTVTNYLLYVGGEQFTSAKLSISGDSGTAVYTPDTNTLTLDNYTYSGAGYNNAAIYYGGNDELKLVINGTNSVTNTSNESVSGYGVYSAANITVSGEGSLSGTGGHNGVHANGSIAVNGGSLTGTSQGETGSGVEAFGSITVNGGTLSGTGHYYGVYVDDSITVESGGLIGIGQSGTGVYASKGNITVNGGNLSGLSQGNGSGVETGDGSIMVLGGTLSGTSNGQNGTGVEISSNIIVSGTGSLTGTGGYRGVNSKKTITVTGNGKLTGTGKTAVSIGNESGSSYTQQPETTDETTGRKTVVLVAGTAAPVTYSINVSAVKTADGAALAGATMQLIDSTGNVVDEWVSEAEVEGLKTDEVYTLRVAVAPDGYLLPSDITFSIDESGNVSSTGTVSADGILLVEFAKTMVKISAVESGAGEAIAGAHLQILDAEDKLVDDWVSALDDEATEDVDESIHMVYGLKIGEVYTLHATVAPDGYAIAADTTFTIRADGTLRTTGSVTGDGVLLSVFDLTVVQVSAVDLSSIGNPLAGATMQIVDASSNVVEEWVSAIDTESTVDVDESIHTVTGLKNGATYTLRATVAPDGYGVPTDITFSIDRNGMISTTGSLTGDGIMLVEFAGRKFTITIANNITNGTVVADKTTAAAGETVTLTFTPADGYQLEYIDITDGKDPSVMGKTEVTFTMPAENVSIYAQFTEGIVVYFDNTESKWTKLYFCYGRNYPNGKDLGNNLYGFIVPADQSGQFTNRLPGMPESAYPEGFFITEEIIPEAGQTYRYVGYDVGLNEGSGGTLTADVTKASKGQTVTLTVTPDSGYVIESVKYNDTEITANNGVYAFTMPAGDVSVTATFVQGTAYPLWVGGEQFTSEKLTITDGSGGTATYDPRTNTLTLNNYTYSGVGYPHSAVYSEQDLTIRLIGENSLVNTEDDGEGISVWRANLVISGSGTLNVTADYGISAYGNVTVEDEIEYYEDKGLLTIQSGTLNVTASEGDGLYADGDIKIENGTLNIDAKGDGIDSGFGDIRISGGQLDIVSAEDKGIDGNDGGNVTISGGTIQIKAPNDEGIDVDGEGVFTMSGGTVTIEAGEDGIDCTDAVTISGGQLNITAGESGIEANDVTISGGSITIQSDADSAILIDGDGKLNLGSDMIMQESVGGKVELEYKPAPIIPIIPDISIIPSIPGIPEIPDTPPTQSVTVPISGNDNTIHVDSEVKGDTAIIDHVNLDHLDTVIGDHVEEIGTVTIDFSVLDKHITTVEIPASAVKEIAEAVNDPTNDAHSFEVILSDGMSIEFDAEAMAEKADQADGKDITISIEHHENVALTEAQKQAVGDRPAYDINVTSGGEHISDMGGKVSVHVPYELAEGEDPDGIVVWYVDEFGKCERCETSYDPIKKRVNWKTDHLSLYMIDYDASLAETCDGVTNCPSKAFRDLNLSLWYHDATDYVIENGLMDGVGGDKFAPSGTATRAMVVTLLWRLEGEPVINYLMQFEDVPSETWYTEAIRWAAGEGIVEGYSKTAFGPMDAITREQIAAILWRYAKYKGYDISTGENYSLDSYVDAESISEYAVSAMKWTCSTELMEGYSLKLSPRENANRVQLAAVLQRFCENVAKK